jgi:hypothetical protein
LAAGSLSRSAQHNGTAMRKATELLRKRHFFLEKPFTCDKMDAQ